MHPLTNNHDHDDPPGGRGALSHGGPRGPNGPCGNARRADRQIRRARVLDNNHIERVLALIECSSNSPRSDELKFLLSVYAGLRVAEITGLTIDAFLTADGTIGSSIVINGNIAKGGRGRIVPTHPVIKDAVARFRKAHPGVAFIAFSNRRGVRRQSTEAVKSWFSRIFSEAGLQGCSSHSGRRTFITRLARSANQFNRSLRDVQLLAGHQRLETTQAYIEPADDLDELVASLGTNQSRQVAA